MTIIQTTTDTKFTAWMLLNLEYYHLKLHSSLENKKKQNTSTQALSVFRQETFPMAGNLCYQENPARGGS